MSQTALLAKNDPLTFSSSRLFPIDAGVAGNNLTISVTAALSIDFRSNAGGLTNSGTVTTVSGTPANLVVPNTATLGTFSTVKSRLIVLVLNNNGTLELAVANVAGANDLTETGLISTTTIAGGSNSANTIYSTTGRSNLAYRVIGYVESTQNTAGTWAIAPSTIQGAGGQAVTSMSSLGYGQTWQNFAVGSARVLSTTYYNTTGRPITLVLNTISGTFTITVNGSTAVTSNMTVITFIIPANASYSVAAVSVGRWDELR